MGMVFLPSNANASKTSQLDKGIAPEASNSLHFVETLGDMGKEYKQMSKYHQLAGMRLSYI